MLETATTSAGRRRELNAQRRQLAARLDMVAEGIRHGLDPVGVIVTELRKLQDQVEACLFELDDLKAEGASDR